MSEEFSEVLQNIYDKMPSREGHLIMDSSKLSTFQECPRKFFFAHVLGWKSEGNSEFHLDFGKAYHSAKETLWKEGGTSAGVEAAYQTFLAEWGKNSEKYMDYPAKGKHPNNVLSALVGFATKYAKDFKELELVNTEVPGSFLLPNNFMLSFRIDSIHKRVNSGEVLFMDDKTASRADANEHTKYNLSLQMGTYFRALMFMHPNEAVIGGFVNTAIFLKDQVNHSRVAVYKGYEQLNFWLGQVTYICGEIKRELEQLMECVPGDSYLDAFPPNTNHCTQYYGCRFADICMAVANPLRYAERAPSGIRIEHWNPFMEAEEKGKEVLHLNENIEVGAS